LFMNSVQTAMSDTDPNNVRTLGACG
jgi:hypothetical protein